MAGSLVWRLIRTALGVWGLVSAVFLLSRHDANTAVRLVLPDPASLSQSGIGADSTARRTAQAATRRRLGLDLPLFYVTWSGASPAGAARWQWHGPRNQYHQWAKGALCGELGTSFRTGQEVTAQLREALAITLPFTGTAALLAVGLALLLAQQLAARPWWQRPAQAALVALHAMPLFVIALLLLLLFANPEVLTWFPTYGFDQPLDPESSAWHNVFDYGAHLVLPVAALTLTVLPELTLQLHAALHQELRADYAMTARAKGLSEKRVIRRHALRNALLPTLTQVAELLPTLVAGAVVVEVVFALPGMGRLLAEASAARDYPVLVGGVLLTGAARLLALLLADLLYLWADPRIRWQT
ncbi:ABC transporter permease [Hymenobacter sp. BT664]|uniref:ABC transporter permease n=1 Tax=Hymenobacter montanus TaxID=2771359 RepID=A0A927BBK9_9BACT|nr:ABC transporter permease [Hymenobacter montanus]MBD2767118.1 ABC transporter permease [Hymenobacter montanus]